MSVDDAPERSEFPNPPVLVAVPPKRPLFDQAVTGFVPVMVEVSAASNHMLNPDID